MKEKEGCSEIGLSRMNLVHFICKYILGSNCSIAV